MQKENVISREISSRAAFLRLRARLWDIRRQQRRESNKRRVSAMMRRNLFISKLRPLSFSAEGTLVDGCPELSLASRSAFQKLLSATSRRYFVKITLSMNDMKTRQKPFAPAISYPFFDTIFRNTIYDVPGNLYITNIPEECGTKIASGEKRNKNKTLSVRQN